jgi:hypothetical protein
MLLIGSLRGMLLFPLPVPSLGLLDSYLPQTKIAKWLEKVLLHEEVTTPIIGNL